MFKQPIQTTDDRLSVAARNRCFFLNVMRAHFRVIDERGVRTFGTESLFPSATVCASIAVFVLCGTNSSLSVNRG